MAESLRFDLLANDRASAVFDKVGDAASKTEGRFSKVSGGLATVGKVAATGLAVGVGLGAVALGKFAVEAQESERVGKLTESIIKSTGGAAKITAAQVGALSTSISNKTGVDDEAIQSGSNLLLTFKNIRNEVGKGNKVFNDATAAAVDLSAAGFGSIEGSSKMLGKALNDPIAGISALGRAGVTFTQQQKDQIAALTESGDVLGAQKIILGEVESQVGGAAAATGTAVDKMKTNFGNLGETIGTSLLPLVNKGAEVGAKFIGGLTTAFQSGGLGGAIGYIGQQISAALPVIQAKLLEWGNAFVDWIGPRIPGMLAKLGELAAAFGTWAIGTALPAIAEKLGQWGDALIGWVGPKIQPMLEKLGDLASKLTDWLLNTGLPKLIEKLSQWGTALIGWIAPMIAPMIVALARFAAKLVLWIVTDGVPLIVAALMSMGSAAVGGLITGLGNKFADLAAKVGDAKDKIVNGFLNAATMLLGEGAQVVSGLIGGIGDKFADLVAKVGDLKGKITGAFSGALTMLSGIGGDIVQGLVNGITGAASAVADAVAALVDKIPGPIRKAMGIASPSKVMAKIGQQIGDGLAVGMTDSQNAVAQAAGAMLGVAGVDGSSALTLSSNAGIGATAASGSLVVNISGVVGDKAAVIAWVHEGLNQYARRNGAPFVASPRG